MLLDHCWLDIRRQGPAEYLLMNKVAYNGQDSRHLKVTSSVGGANCLLNGKCCAWTVPTAHLLVHCTLLSSCNSRGQWSNRLLHSLILIQPQQILVLIGAEKRWTKTPWGWIARLEFKTSQLSISHDGVCLGMWEVISKVAMGWWCSENPISPQWTNQFYSPRPIRCKTYLSIWRFLNMPTKQKHHTCQVIWKRKHAYIFA